MPDTPRLPPLPFAEAIAWARDRRVVLPEVYYGELQGLVRAQAFTISGLAGLDQIQAVKDSLTRVLETGETFQRWQQRIRDGEIPFQVGPAQIETIFRNNIQQSYNRGRYEQQMGVLDSHPWWMYDGVNDGRIRPTHAAMDGHVARHDDPIWSQWTPSCGHRCRCRRIALTERQATRYQAEDARRQADPMQAKGRQAALIQGPDPGWGHDPYREPNRGLKEAITKRQSDCAQASRLAAAPVASGCPMGPALEGLLRGLEPRAVADELRDRLGAAAWRRFETRSRAAGTALALPVEQRVALSAYTDRPLGALINATARAMSDLAVTVPADHALALWLIRAMDAGLAALPPSPGVYFRGQAVHGPGGAMPPELAARWEDAHRPGRDVQYFGYTSVMGNEGRQYAGDWQMAILTESARDLSDFSVVDDPEWLIPRRTVFRYGGMRGYRLLMEVDMKSVKPSRQFAVESSLDDLRRAGFSERAIKALDAATRGAAERRAAWEAAGRPGEAAMLERLQRETDLQCYGTPGYARNAIIDAEIAALLHNAKAR